MKFHMTVINKPASLMIVCAYTHMCYIPWYVDKFQMMEVYMNRNDCRESTQGVIINLCCIIACLPFSTYNIAIFGGGSM
jgi:hypothetical protein